MYCPRCGKELTGAPKFCIYCGHALEEEKTQGYAPAETAQPVQEVQTAASAQGRTPAADTAPVKAKAQAAAAGKRRGRRLAALCAAIVLIAGVAVGGYWGCRQYQVHSLCEEADAARAQWRVQDAARAWRQALALQPECTEAYLGLSELSRIFSNTTNAILILNDGLAAGADSAELNRALDKLCGPDISEHSILPQILNDITWGIGTFSRYSRNGNLLYHGDVYLSSPERQISLEDDILRPSSFARGDGTVTRTYDALGLLASENCTGTKYTQDFEWTNDSETGLPLSFRTAHGDSNGSISQTLYEYDYTDSRLTSLTVTHQSGRRDEKLTQEGKTTYLFTYSGAPAAITVTTSADSDYLAELDERGFLSKIQPVAFNSYGFAWNEFSYDGDGQLVELSLSGPTSSGITTDSVGFHYDENRHVSGLYSDEEQIEVSLFPEE